MTAPTETTTDHTPAAGQVLSARGVKKAFGELEVLRGLDLEMHRGEVVVLIGPSGSGKSTLLRCLNRLVDPDAGEIVVNGTPITGAKVDLPQARRQIGFVAQSFNLYPHMTALQNVMEGPRTVLRLSRDALRPRAEELLGRVGLAAKLDSYPRQLSGGQQQRVAIARALAMQPAVMLFDEPTSALDPELTGEVLDVMKELADEGMTMLVASHEMHFARRVAHRVVMIDEGVVVEQGPPEEFFGNPGHERTRRFLSQLMSWDKA
jgi:ABC-type polar amino acid transport system ATPase subunit